MALDPGDARVGIQEELARLARRVPATRFAAVASEDGLLVATHVEAEPNAVDRRGAVLASLVALARTAAREYSLQDARWLILGCREGTLFVRPFGKKRRRLLLLVLADSQQLGAALAAAKDVAIRLDARFGHPAEAAPAAA
jgi:predicted regulator of Ras-like GTPase activity (Roadblock/LC7/MglB family)